mmetsp:Transcript_92682/g.262068  ORF Transcript_92682/g.262068 Transcript_92682/m.262068 type:complete len:200 (+) Transcript_92682:897-1496(+)
MRVNMLVFMVFIAAVACATVLNFTRQLPIFPSTSGSSLTFSKPLQNAPMMSLSSFSVKPVGISLMTNVFKGARSSGLMALSLAAPLAEMPLGAAVVLRAATMPRPGLMRPPPSRLPMLAGDAIFGGTAFLGAGACLTGGTTTPFTGILGLFSGGPNSQLINCCGALGSEEQLSLCIANAQLGTELNLTEATFLPAMLCV